jgi:hypothetical protein
VDADRLAGLIGLVWLIMAVVLMAGSVRRGRRLAAELANRHPELYEALGRPMPGLLDSPRRSRFARYVGTREYRELDDPSLVREFETHRQAEGRVLLFLLASLAVLGLLMLALRPGT